MGRLTWTLKSKYSYLEAWRNFKDTLITLGDTLNRIHTSFDF